MSQPAKVEFYVGGSLSRVQRENSSKHPPSQVGGGKRGSVSTFSNASRRRLLRQVAKIRRDEPTLFITLTYPDNFPEEPTKWKRDLKAFSARLERQYPSASFIWRLELKLRKSGQNAGKIAPHSHLFLYGVSSKENFNINSFRKWLSLSWFQTVGSQDNKHFLAGTNCKPMRSWRGSMAYAAKYMTKFDEAELMGIGRHWGVYFRKMLPEAELIELDITDEQAVKIIRMYRRFSNVKARSYQSLSIFLDAKQWLDGIVRLYELNSPSESEVLSE